MNKKTRKHTQRNHPGLVWEDGNLHNCFTDINRMALDNKYGKVGAPLSKRRTGTGPAGRNAPPGLFGSPFEMPSTWSIEKQSYVKGGMATALVYLAADAMFLASSKSPIQKRIARSLPVLIGGGLVFLALAPE